ncbi:MAG: hypothetical protein EOP84_27835 [Verrucomicrobiaceae bacterium]|nr:MAG: hypothetical protein EOP84_27835 [Verrucomicrobiaceae bacterium]
MAKKIPIRDIQDENHLLVLIDAAVKKNWTRLFISQPVHWPEVNRFLEAAKGEYLSISRLSDTSVKTADNWTQWSYQQNFWFSDPNAAFEFKMRFC